MSENIANRDQLVEVNAEYFVYPLASDGERRLPPGKTFRRTCSRIVRWSAATEFRARHRAQAHLTARPDHLDSGGEDAPIENPNHSRRALLRHCDRVGTMVRQLVALATLRTLMYTECCCCEAFEDALSFGVGSSDQYRVLFRCLPTDAWPQHPGIPPFMAESTDLFSPIPIEGLRPYEGCAPVGAFTFQVPRWFLNAGGWHSMKRLRYEP